MKKINVRYWISLFVSIAVAAVIISACNDDDDGPAGLTAVSVTADGIPLDEATSADNVPVDAEILVEFDKDVDTTGAVITLMRGGNEAEIEIEVSGNEITIRPVNNLDPGSDYTLRIEDVTATDGGSFNGIQLTFTTAGKSIAEAPKEGNLVAFWLFDGSAEERSGVFTVSAEENIEYTTDRAGFENSAALFNGDNSIIEVDRGDSLLSQDWTLSFWLMLDTVGHVDANGNRAGHFVMGVGAFHGFQVEFSGNGGSMKLAARYSLEDGSTIGNDFFCNADGMDANNGGFEAIEFEADLSPQGGMSAIIPQNWSHIVLTYNSESNTRSFYLNGSLVQTDNLNNAPALAGINGMTFDASGTAATIGNKLAFGFAFDRETNLWDNEPWGNFDVETSNHFKGALDDVRFFNTFYTTSDVQALYNAEKAD